MNQNPLVSIIMATYNRAHFIVETLQSIQNQTYQNWECLIINDGGTDNTLEVITPILVKDNRFQYLKRPNNYRKGLPGCRNYGLDIAKGDYIIFFDDDDMVHPQNIEICLNTLENNIYDFCHYQKEPFYKKIPKIYNITTLEIRGELNCDKIEKIVTQKIGIASCTVMWKRKCFNTHRFNESLQYAEEWELYTRLISERINGVIINNVLYYNRKHPNSNTGEFYLNDPIRRTSMKNAIVLVVMNLKNKQLLSNSLLRYFVQLSIGFKEFKLFEQILEKLEFNFLERCKWSLSYKFLPIKLKVYKLKKKFINSLK